MKKNKLALKEPAWIRGIGDSLWCKPDVSNKLFEVTEYIFNDFCDTDEPYELQLFGPETEWRHYTDSGIQSGVNKHLLKWVRGLYPKFEISHISWSEQGMQPDGGWSFDIIVKNR